jgi:hypothetical protein
MVEAHDRVALSRGMQALQIRAARALNLAQDRRGRVFADRFHARILRTPTEVANVRGYVLQNLAVHCARSGDDRRVEDKLTSEWNDGLRVPADDLAVIHRLAKVAAALRSEVRAGAGRARRL